MLAKAGKPWARLLNSPPGERAPCCIATTSDEPDGVSTRQL